MLSLAFSKTYVIHRCLLTFELIPLLDTSLLNQHFCHCYCCRYLVNHFGRHSRIKCAIHQLFVLIVVIVINIVIIIMTMTMTMIIIYIIITHVVISKIERTITCT